MPDSYKLGAEEFRYLIAIKGATPVGCGFIGREMRCIHFRLWGEASRNIDIRQIKS